MVISDCQWPEGSERKHFWAGYIKGAARTTTVLTLASIISDLNVDLANVAPDLMNSMTAIQARVGLLFADKASIAIENAKLSARGAIRRSHDILTWLGKLSLLRASGLDPAAVIKRWNNVATKESMVTGSKRVACLQLMEAVSEATLAILLQHVGEVGPDGTCFSEDAFANKRLLPGFSPRGLSVKWARRLKTTDISFQLMLRFLIHGHSKKLPALRRKYDKHTLEEAAAMASLVIALGAEVQEVVPITEEKLGKDWTEHFVKGDPNLEMELRVALQDKDDKFVPASINALKDLLSVQSAESDSRIPASR